LRQCGIYLQRTHDNNYVRIEPDELESDKLEEEILPPLARNKTKILETVFVKAEVTGITWRKSDMCRRIAGFHFPSVDNDLDECEVWVSELAGRKKARFHSTLRAKYQPLLGAVLTRSQIAALRYWLNMIAERSTEKVMIGLGGAAKTAIPQIPTGCRAIVVNGK
jgi:hypothetical protein